VGNLQSKIKELVENEGLDLSGVDISKIINGLKKGARLIA